MAAEKAFLDGLAGAHPRRHCRRPADPDPGVRGPARLPGRAPAPTLEGVEWKVTGFNNGRQGGGEPAHRDHRDALLREREGDGISTGCNTFRAPYTSEGNRLSIGAAATTRKLCPAEGVMEQERQFLAALKTAQVWTVESGTLDVHRADGERVLMAKGTTGSSP